MTLLPEMTSRYTSPPEDVVDHFVYRLLQLEDETGIRVEISEILESERIPWLRSHRSVDVTFDISNSGSQCFVSSLGNNCSSGSGSSENLTRSTVHAASEALERLFGKHHGQSDLRPSHRSALRLKDCTWFTFPGDPCALEWESSTHNPNFSVSGEAYHPIPGDALRAAYVEVLEKDAIADLFSRQRRAIDVTKAGTNASEIVAECQSVLKDIGYELRLLSICNDWNVWVVFAYCISLDESVFRSCFKGSGADFSFQHALEHAVMELGRNAFTGPAVTFQTENDAKQFLLSASPKWEPILENVRILFPENRKKMIEILNGVVSVDQVSVHTDFNSFDSVRSVIDSGRDIFVIPLTQNPWSLPGAAFKVFIPGLMKRPSILS